MVTTGSNIYGGNINVIVGNSMKTICFVCLFLFLLGCGTSRRSLETKKRVCTDAILSEDFFRKDSLLVNNQLSTKEKLQMNFIVTEWSQPDTAGKQYPVKTAEISFNKEQKEQLIVNELSGSEVTIQKKDSILIIEEEATKDDVTKDNRLLPLWVWWLPALSPPYTTNL